MKKKEKKRKREERRKKKEERRKKTDRGLFQAAQEVVVLQLEDVLLAEPVLGGVVLHAQAGLLGQQPRLDGPFLRQKGRARRRLGQSDPRQTRFL